MFGKNCQKKCFEKKMFLAHRKDEQLKPGNGPVRGSLFHSKYVFVATNFKEISRNEEIETSNAF
jgi:hypothetical protein